MESHIIFIILSCIITIIALVIAVFIILGLDKKNSNKLKESTQKDMNQIRDEIIKMEQRFVEEIQGLALQQEEHNSNARKKDRDLFNTFVKLRDSIKENCMNTMHDTKACRLAVYLLHNGSSSTHGVRFFKMSCICEKVAIGSGIREQSIEHSNIPINLFDDMVEKLINDGKYIIVNDDELNNRNCRIFISAQKIKYSQAVAIFDLNNNILGFVLAEMDHPYDRDIALQEKEKIDVFVNQLVPILSYSEYVETAIERQEDAQHE
jgi:hypothetical protein